MSWIRLGIAAAAFVGVASVASAQGQGGNPPQSGEQQGSPKEARIARRLFLGIDLTAAQNQQLEKIMEKYAAEKRASPADNADEATRARKIDMIIRSQAEYRTILTADQQKIFDKNAAELKARMEERQKQQRK